MNRELEESIKQITQDIRDITYVDESRIPDIGLYMDQVIAYLGDQLSECRRSDDDKIMTKTMINNYAKNGLIPPPVKKKYSSEHVMILVLLFYYKNFLSMSDIDMLLSPVIKEHYQNSDSEIQFGDVFHEIFSILNDSRGVLDKSVDEALEMSQKAFADTNLTDEDRDNIQLLVFTSILGQDIFAKLMIMQRLIDRMPKDKSKKEKDDH